MQRLTYTKLLIFLFCLAVSGLGAQTVINQQGLNGPQEKDPVLRADGRVLFFTRPDFENNKGTDNAADIWITNRYADGSWGRALNPGSPINSFAHDRALAISPDGTRLAVLRTGTANFIDLLESSGRNWRVLATWTLPEDVYPRYDLTFDPNGQHLIYSTYAQGNLNLFQREALPNGQWARPEPLNALNGPGNETAPSLASDGRTLYFQRDGNRWFKQASPGARPEAVAIPESVKQFSPSLNGREIVAAVTTGSVGEHLQVVSATGADLPSSGKVFRGQLPAPPPMGEDVARIALSNGEALSVRPDVLQRYAVFLREGESVAGSAALSGNRVAPGLADAQSVTAPATARSHIEAGIARRQRELDRLDQERRAFDLVAPKTEDPELSALRNQYRTLSGDTLPPRTSAKGAQPGTRYAAELSELERMKAKFRRQQNEKLDRGSRGSHRWSGTETAKPTPATTTVPRIGESYRPVDRAGLATARERAYQDSLRLAAEIRAGLQRDNGPRVYERASWENQVREGLPQKEPLSPDEVVKLDADYQRNLAELEALRAELKRLDGPTPSVNPQPAPAAYAYPAPQRWSAKGSSYPNPSTTQQVPQTYSQPAASPQQVQTPAPATNYAVPQQQMAPPGGYGSPTPRGLSGAPMPAGISFIPNTAYPDSRGYTGLDQLLGLIKQSTSVLEIRVHTPLNLAPRAAQLLSEERATTIRNFLTDKGIPSANYQVIGFGNNVTGQQGERVEVVR
jgi:outer membrane protein OmpA-like peptidoglycan-associated protein